MLIDVIAQHREEIIERTRHRLAQRTAPRVTPEELSRGVPLFLTQLSLFLRHAASPVPDNVALRDQATERGGDLLEQGFTIAQVVLDYGDICQAITGLAADRRIPVSIEDFQALNQCLDTAIASAVTEYARRREGDLKGAESERQGFFAHELRNHLSTAAVAFELLRTGKVSLAGSTVQVLERSLRSLRELVDRSVLRVRLTSGIHRKERLRLAELIEELEMTASIEASARGLHLTVDHVAPELELDGDRHLLASAIANLLQNALKFTRPGSHVRLRTRTSGEHVLIEVEDECGGLPPGTAEAIFMPFEQRGLERTGLGLGLPISRQAIEANGGKLSVRDMPGTGCVFVVELPLAPAISGVEVGR